MPTTPPAKSAAASRLSLCLDHQPPLLEHQQQNSRTTMSPSLMRMTATAAAATALSEQQPQPQPAPPAGSSTATSSEEGIQVAIRMRPLSQNEGNYQRVWKVMPQHHSIAQIAPENGKQPHHSLSERVIGRNFFTFDKTFGEDVSTKQVYDSVAKNIVTSVVSGLNGTIFAYGQTSSGKTYTMQGAGTIAEGAGTNDGSSSPSGGGIVHMAAADIFRLIRQEQNRVFLVRASFLEIYNEEVRDLLAPDTKVLAIREDPRKGVFVQSEEQVVTDFGSLLHILFTGEKSRKFAATDMNERSSRSHTIFRITIESHAKSTASVTTAGSTSDEEDDDSGGDSGAVLISTLNLVDLAGSESVRHTGARGERQKEGGMINQSLLTLSRVIVALGTPNQTHINFRDSKLTRILQPSLSGNARMAVICCATPSELYLEETRSTLAFASRAKLVKTCAKVNEVLDDRSLIRQLRRDLAEARRNGGGGGGAAQTEHVRALQAQAETAGTEAKIARQKLQRLQSSILNGNVSFLEPVQEIQETLPKKQPKRRLSDSVLPAVPSSTPIKDQIMKQAPQTAIRPIKKSKPEGELPTSPSAELSILRLAVVAKNTAVKALKENLADISRLVQEKKTELAAASSQNDDLVAERDGVNEQSAKLAQELKCLHAKFQEATDAHEAMMMEKEQAVDEALAKLESELVDRQRFEQKVEELEAAQNETTEKLQGLKSELKTAKIALASSESARETNCKRLADASVQIEELTARNSKLQSDLDEYTNNVGTLTQERDAANAQITHLTFSHESLLKGYESLQGEHDKQGCELAEKNNQLHSSEALLRERTIQLENVTKERDETTGRVEEVERLIESKEHERAELAAALVDAQATIQLLTSKVQELSVSLQEKIDEINQVSLERDTHAERMMELEESQRLSQENANKLRGELEACSHNLIMANAQQEETAQSLLQTRAEKDQIVVALAECREELASMVEARDNAVSHVQDLEAIQSDSTAALDALRSELQTTNIALSSSESERTGLANQLAILQERESHLEANLATSNAKIAELDSTLNDTAKEVSMLEGKLAESSSELNKLQCRFAENIQALDCLNTTLEQRKVELENASRAQDTIAARAVEVERVLESKEFECAQLAASLTDAQESLTAKCQELSAVVQQKTAEIKRLALECDNQTALVAEMEEKLVLAQEETTKLQVELATSSSNLATVKSEHEVTTHSLMETRAENERIAVTLAECRAELTSVAESRHVALARVLDLETMHGESNNALDALQSELRSANSALSSAQSERDELASKLQILQERETQLEKDIAESKAKVVELDDILNDTMKKVSTLEAQVTESNNKLASMECLHSQTIEQLDSMTAKNSDIMTTLEEKDTEVSRIMLERDDAFNSRDSAVARTIEVEALVASLEQQLGTKVAENESLVLSFTEAQARTTELQNELAETSNNVRSLQTSHDKLTIQLQAALDARGSADAQAEEMIAALKGQLKNKESELEGLVLSVTDADAQIAQLQCDLAESSNNLEILQSSHDELKSKLEDDLKAKDAINARAEEADQLIDSLQSELETKESELETLQQREQQLSLDLSASQSKVQELDSILNETFKEITALEGQLAERNNKLTSMETSQQKALLEAEAKVNELTTAVSTLEANVEMGSKTIGVLERERDSLKSRITGLSQLNKQLESRIQATSTELSDHCERLQNDLRAKEAVLAETVNALEAEKAELANHFEKQKEENHGLARKVQQLQEELGLAATSHSTNEKSSSPEYENSELKQLLASSNEREKELREALDATDADLTETKIQLEQTRAMLERKNEELLDARSSHEMYRTDDVSSSAGVESIVADWKTRLEAEREDRKRSEEEMKRVASDEQRLLIQEAETQMQRLRAEKEELAQSLKQSEDAAYNTRQLNEELQDECKHNLNNAIQAQSKASSLENEVARLKKRLSREDSETAALASELKQVKAEMSSKEAALRNLRDKFQLLETEHASTKHELNSMFDEMSRKHVDLKNENDRLESEMSVLRTQLADAKQEIDDQSREFQAQMQAKDERMVKLESCRLTREKIAHWKKMKQENDQLKAEIELLRQANLGEEDTSGRKIESKASIDSGDTHKTQASSHSAETTSLVFHNEALETKLRKYASHCQKLEAEKARIQKTLASCKLEEVASMDIPSAVATLCDKVTSMDESYQSFANKARAKIDKGRERERLLKEQISQVEAKVDELVLTEANLRQKLELARRENKDLQKEVRQAHESATEEVEEKTQKIRCLEEEMLRTMEDLQDTKKQLQRAKHEINLLRSGVPDLSMSMNTTREESFPVVQNNSRKSKTTATTSRSTSAAGHPSVEAVAAGKLVDFEQSPTRKRGIPSTPNAKENNANGGGMSAKVRRILTPGRKKPSAVPGLGETHDDDGMNNENTQECKQS